MLPRISRIVLPPLILVAALVVYRFAYSALMAEPPQLGHAPIQIEPRFDEPRVVTDEQLAAVLGRVKPPAKPLKTNNVVHALRLWGTQADFQTAEAERPGSTVKNNDQVATQVFPSGQEMLNYLLDDRTYQKYAGPSEPPLFVRGSDGIQARSYDDAITHRET
jgi:hypothetical protein